MARSLRKTTGSHLSLTSNSTQWDTRHAWHTQVKDRSASQLQGILAAMPRYSRTASEISTHNGRETPLTQIWKEWQNIHFSIWYTIALIAIVCINTDKLGFGLQIFWALCMEGASHQYEERWTPVKWALLLRVSKGRQGGEANNMGEDVSHSKLEKLLVGC